jgi:hypothetical protein
MRWVRTGSRVWSVAACMAVIAMAMPKAPAMTAGPGFAVSDYAVGFPTDPQGSHLGPTGLAFDGPSPSANLYVMDYGNGFLYKFPLGGGTASEATKVNKQAYDLTRDRANGLAFSLDFKHLYVTFQNGMVVGEVNPTTGERLPTTLPSGSLLSLHFPTGLATDPLTGDLFVSQPDAGNPIIRISPSTGAMSVYANVTVDGLTFDSRDGTFYAGDESKGLFSVDRSGKVTPIDSGLSGVDGVAIAATSVPRQPPYLFVNQTSGVISKIDLTTTPPKTTTVASGGDRGDFTTVGPDGCLYATQLDKVVKVTNADGSCSLAPPDPAITGSGVPLPSSSEGTEVSGTVATFTDPDPLAQANEYRADVDWGDGQTSLGSVGSVAKGSFAVNTRHAYDEEGHYTVAVRISDKDTLNNVAEVKTDTTVLDAPLQATGASLEAMRGVAFAGDIALFSDANPDPTIADYTASINWGDNASSAGTLKSRGSRFAVAGNHTYAALGSFSIGAHVCDVGGTCTDTISTIAVGASPVSSTSILGASSGQLILDPPIGPPGFVTAAVGKGFPSGVSIDLIWSRGLGKVTVKADAEGAFRTPVLVFRKDAPGPRFLVARNPGAADSPPARAPFLVVLPPFDPPGIVTRR